MYNFAKNRDLKNIFITLTLPSEYHLYTTINGRKVKNKNYINDVAHNPKNGSKFLSKMFKRILDLRSIRNLDKNDRVYFRVTEPHKDGTPHLHISLFVLKYKADKIVSDIERLYSAPASKVELNVNNPVSYLMKYILKTLDDLRYGENKISDLSYWYIYHGICRFYTSRTLVSLDVYRVLGGRYALLELTRMIRDREIKVLVDVDTNAVKEILDSEGYSIYMKKDFKECKFKTPYKFLSKPTLKENKSSNISYFDINDDKYTFHKKIGFTRCASAGFDFKNASDLSLAQYSRSINLNTVDFNHFDLVQNELSSRGLSSDITFNEFDRLFEEFEDVYS